MGACEAGKARQQGPARAPGAAQAAVVSLERREAVCDLVPLGALLEAQDQCRRQAVDLGHLCT